MSSGFIKLHREELNSGILKNHNLFVFWIWCLSKATYKHIDIIVGYQQVSLAPGQFVFGRKKAADALGMSVQTIRTCKKALEKLKKITSKPTNKFSVISIVDWDTSQGSYIGANHQLPIQQPTTNHKQEYKKQKELKRTTTIESSQFSFLCSLLPEAFKTNKDVLNSVKKFNHKGTEYIKNEIEYSKDRSKNGGFSGYFAKSLENGWGNNHANQKKIKTKLKAKDFKEADEKIKADIKRQNDLSSQQNKLKKLVNSINSEDLDQYILENIELNPVQKKLFQQNKRTKLRLCHVENFIFQRKIINK